MKYFIKNGYLAAILLSIGCGASDTLGREPAASSESATQSSSKPSSENWVSGDIPSDTASASQLGGGEAFEDDDGYVEDGIEFWHGGSLEISSDGRAEGFGEYAIVQVDYAAEEEVILCYVTWSIESTQALDSCRDCTWAFEVQTGPVQYDDGSQEACLQNGFEPEQFEFALLNIGSREGTFLMIEADDWEPVGEVTYLQDDGIWEYEIFMGEDD